MRFKHGEKSIMQKLLSAIEVFFVHLVKHSTKFKQKADFPSCVKREGWNAATAAAHCSEQIRKLKNGERNKCVGRWNYIEYKDRIDLKSDSVSVDVKMPQLKTGTQIGNTKSGIKQLTTCFWQSKIVEKHICLTVPLSAEWEVFVSCS